MSTLPNSLQGQNPQNPLGWPGATGTNAPSVPGGPQLFGSPPPPDIGPTSGAASRAPGGALNPFGQGVRGGGDLTYNLAGQNLVTGDWRNKLIPWFTQMMSGSAGPAMDFFKKLMDLGSPYYKEQQRASLEQGVNQAQNTAAGSQQRLNAAGYGAAPSGLQAAMIGGEATGEANNLSQMFLQNLFQNEQMQMGGAQGLSQLAQLFNPAALTGQSTNPNIQQPTNTAAETMAGIGQLASGIFGNKGIPTGGK